MVKIFIHRAEEEALGIDQNATEKYRRDNQIPDSDGFAMIVPREKRGRSETMSTNISDKHDTNPNMQVYKRLYWSNYLCIFYHSNSKEVHHFNISELAVAQNPRESTATFLTGYRDG